MHRPVSGHGPGAIVGLALLDFRPIVANCRALDMGADFDCFDPRANTASAATGADYDVPVG